MSNSVEHEDVWSQIEWREQDLVLVFRRTAEPFKTLAEAAALLKRFEAIALQRAPQARGLMVDSRSAPLRTDPEFEALSKATFDGLLNRFPRVAVLIATATGKLQVNRIRRERAVPYEVFDNEDAAMAYLRSRSSNSNLPKPDRS